MQDSTLTSDKVLNTWIYGSPFCIIVYRSYKLSKKVVFYGLNYSVFSMWYRFPEFTQRIFKYDDIQNSHFAPDKELSILVD